MRGNLHVRFLGEAAAATLPPYPISYQQESYMLSGAENQSLYREYYELIQDSDAKQAYSYLIGWASSLKNHNCLPSAHGVIKDFRIMRGNDWDFAFIPNQKWLLFYFRRPCQKLEKFAHVNILSKFPEANENNHGEITIRIKTLEEAIKLAAYIDS